MANYDSGHYFLTLLIPIRMGSVLRNGQSHSRRHLIREALHALPIGESTIATEGQGAASPFARNQATHFARFVVIDNVPYNGKVSRNALLTTLLGALPKKLQPQPKTIDQLSTPYLLLAVDFDAANGDATELNLYLETLWCDMRAELVNILQHCHGFDNITTAQDFAAYARRCQVETTMPYNDYWVPPPPLKDLSLKAYLYPGIAAAAVFVLSLLWGVFRPGYGPEFFFILSFAALIGIIYLAIRGIYAAAAVPFPASPELRATLPNVLKALYVQRGFTQFAITAQGKSDEDLHAAFGAFWHTYQPDAATPTQAPGVIGQ
jgi:hypothetical protein